MTTSRITREYWVQHAKEWAEGRLADFRGGSTPQLDEFNDVMNELYAESLEAGKLRAAAERAVQLLGNLEFYNEVYKIMTPAQVVEYEAAADGLLAALGIIKARKDGE